MFCPPDGEPRQEPARRARVQQTQVGRRRQFEARPERRARGSAEKSQGSSGDDADQRPLDLHQEQGHAKVHFLAVLDILIFVLGFLSLDQLEQE